MGAHEGAEVAADAVFREPAGHMGGKAPLLILGRGHGDAAVRRVPEGADGEAVALLGVDGLHDRPDVPGGGGIRLLQLVGEVRPGGGDGDFQDAGQARVHGGAVHLNHLVALAAIGLLNRGLHVVHGLFHGENAAEPEKGGLQDAVGPVPQADGPGGGPGVDGVEFRLPLRQEALDPVGEAGLQFLAGPAAVEEEGAALLELADDVVLGYVALVVAGDKVRHGDVIGGENGRAAEAEVAFRHAAGLLGVVLKVRLNILVRVVADDLDGILVGPHGSVGPQTPEFAADGSGPGGNDVFPHGQGEMGYIVGDAHGEVVPLFAVHVVEYGDHLSRGGVLAGEAVTAPQDLNAALPLLEDGADVLVKGFASRAGLLGPVQDGEDLAALRQRGQEVPGAEGPVQPDLKEAGAAALLVQVLNHLLKASGDAAHSDNHLVRLRIAVVVEEPVVPACQGGHPGHVILHDAGDGVVIGVHRLPELEGRVRVDDGGAHEGMFAVQGIAPEAVQGLPVHHAVQVAVVQHVDFLNLVGGPEAVEEVHKGHPGPDGGEVRHRRQVHALLHAGGGQLGKARLAAGHDVGVVAEDGEGAGAHSPGSDVDNAGEELARNAVQRRNHEHEALAGGVAGGEGPSLQRAVHGPAGSGLALHFHEAHRLAEEVLHAVGGPGVHVLGHGAGGRDGIDGGDFGECVAGVCGGLVAVHGFAFHKAPPLLNYPAAAVFICLL